MLSHSIQPFYPNFKMMMIIFVYPFVNYFSIRVELYKASPGPDVIFQSKVSLSFLRAIEDFLPLEAKGRHEEVGS